jgi:hypothetical protein
MKTQETITWLREIADQLEAIQDDFPELSWWHAFHEPLYNSGMVASHDGCIEKDIVNAHLGTHVRAGGPGRWARWISVYADAGVKGHMIQVLGIKDVEFCHLENVKARIMEAVSDLPNEAKWPIYRIMAARRRAHRREKHDRLMALRRELAELTQNGGNPTQRLRGGNKQ